MIRALIVLLMLTAVPVFAATEGEMEERKCLALNIYFEGRNQDNEGQKSIGFVTLNRVLSERYPNTICSVVWQKGWSKRANKWVAQFSWTLDGKSDRPKNTKAWKRAMMNADYVIQNYYLDSTNGALYYHADYVKPFWSRKLELKKKVGKHLFY